MRTIISERKQNVYEIDNSIEKSFHKCIQKTNQIILNRMNFHPSPFSYARLSLVNDLSLFSLDNLL